MVQIAFCIKACRHSKLRQKQVSKFQLYIATFGNKVGVCKSLRTIGELLRHFLITLQIELVIGETHTVRFINSTTCLQAQEHVLRFRIFTTNIVQVVSCDQAKTIFFRQLLQTTVCLMFFRQVVVLNFQEIVFFAKDFDMFFQATASTVHITLLNQHWKFTSDTSTKADDTFAMSTQNILVHTRFIIETFQLRQRNHLHYIMVAFQIFC